MQTFTEIWECLQSKKRERPSQKNIKNTAWPRQYWSSTIPRQPMPNEMTKNDQTSWISDVIISKSSAVYISSKNKEKIPLGKLLVLGLLSL